MVADQAEPALGVEAIIAVADDPRRFLSPVLQRMKPKRHERGGLRMTEDAEHAALFVQTVRIEVKYVFCVGACRGRGVDRHVRLPQAGSTACSAPQA
ncbi:hypothetical protein GCM10008179_12340 [Hansschlegelia plantiphila]|uniref:Uncharacterized protein n=1 Tax=Hansschlegelia plantiphila TaxID=374655 RepID=A0A9W6J0N8_9HYPH|nr:hypothetical protein GCM10008179_12340 [Hansschlegelia plantiphila]